jgi:hypothetical protein
MEDEHEFVVAMAGLVRHVFCSWEADIKHRGTDHRQGGGAVEEVTALRLIGR